ncbi:MAG: hypothetical protein ABJH98_10805 [Reichenbachiella sp.]|uniref:hypothetical protein n=1 Tax=Reichenbachiella sp. TaxID=2184521 RepID=UPI0032970833
MKINGNHKNGISKDLKESTTDQVSKKAVSVVENVPLKNFDASDTWRKIAHKLGHVDKRFVTWGLAMAASFSLLVAANVDLFTWESFNPQPEPEVATNNTFIDKKEVFIAATSIKPEIIITEIKPQSQEQKSTLHTPVEKRAIKTNPKTILLLDKKDRQNIALYPLTNPFVSVFAKANIGSGSITPEIGIDFKLAENYTAKRRDIFKLGVSSQFNFKTDETGDKKVHPHTFVNLDFTSLNKKTNKGWTTRAGYLLNPDGQLYQDTTVKVSLFRNINKHIKIGPEVIFTDNLKTAYPSISLVLG